jgi:acyl-coenzyme A synthetase/AMP-(fatty) acid ligase
MGDLESRWRCRPTVCVFAKSIAESWRNLFESSYTGITHPAAELEYTITDSQSKTVICHDDYLALIEPIANKHGLRLIKLSQVATARAVTGAHNTDIRSDRRAMIVYTRYGACVNQDFNFAHI